MGFVTEERLSDSPYVEAVMHGVTVGSGTTIRPAECHWHLVLTKHNGIPEVLAVGPWTTAGIVTFGEDAEILWIKFKLGTFMPHMPTERLVDQETHLPLTAPQSFWLNNSAWQFPDYENADTFVSRLVREEVLVHDPVVSGVLQGQRQERSPRTVRHRFLRATGLTQTHILQYERAQQAAALLRQGVSILDTVYDVGYYDQPHLTRSLKRWLGYTPAQIVEMATADVCDAVHEISSETAYGVNAVVEIP